MRTVAAMRKHENSLLATAPGFDDDLEFQMSFALDLLRGVEGILGYGEEAGLEEGDLGAASSLVGIARKRLERFDLTGFARALEDRRFIMVPHPTAPNATYIACAKCSQETLRPGKE